MNKLEVNDKLQNYRLPEEWKKVKLGEVIKEISFKVGKTTLKPVAIGVSGFRFRDELYYKELTNDYSNYKIFPYGYLAFGLGTNEIVCGVNLYKGEVYCVSPAYKVFHIESSDIIFFHHFIDYFKHIWGDRFLVISARQGKTLDFKIFLQESIFLPQLPEQQKIAEILENIDQTIEKTDAIIEKYKRIKQGLMQDFLTRGIDENGKIRSEETHKFKDSSLGRIPEEWEVKRIIDAIGVKRNLIIAGPFGSNLKVSDYKKSGIPLIRLQNIEENKFINKDIKYISRKKGKELYYHSFKNGDIVLAKLGIPVGKTCIIPKNFKFGIVVADVVRIRVIDECADKEFITYILNFNTCRKRLNMEIIGTTRPRVNLTQIRSLQLPLPSIYEQQRIASILSQIDETIEKEKKYKEKLGRIKQGLMEDLLTGNVRVFNVN